MASTVNIGYELGVDFAWSDCSDGSNAVPSAIYDSPYGYVCGTPGRIIHLPPIIFGTCVRRYFNIAKDQYDTGFGNFDVVFRYATVVFSINAEVGVDGPSFELLPGFGINVTRGPYLCLQFGLWGV